MVEEKRKEGWGELKKDMKTFERGEKVAGVKADGEKGHRNEGKVKWKEINNGQK